MAHRNGSGRLAEDGGHTWQPGAVILDLYEVLDVIGIRDFETAVSVSWELDRECDFGRERS